MLGSQCVGNTSSRPCIHIHLAGTICDSMTAMLAKASSAKAACARPEKRKRKHSHPIMAARDRAHWPVSRASTRSLQP